jgi:hypothetical protein
VHRAFRRLWPFHNKAERDHDQSQV